MQKPQYPKLPITADRRRKLTPHHIAEIRRLKSEGHTERAIAEAFNVNRCTVQYWCGQAERKNKRTIERLKRKPRDIARRSEIQKATYQHRIAVQGVDVVRKFQREYKKATLRLYKDYRTTCKACGYRYSSKKHQTCPKCLIKSKPPIL